MKVRQGGLLQDRVISTGESPGHRNFFLTVDLDRGDRVERVELCFGKEDSARMAEALVRIHQLAWEGAGPIDREPRERRPWWLK